MNKKEFINELSNRTSLSTEECAKINDILESNMIIGKKNKDKIIDNIKEKLGYTDEKSNEIYETAMDIFGEEIKNKLKHPFKSQD